MRQCNGHPLLSVVVSTGGAAELLRQKLESLCTQTLDRDAFEVVVVDQGSSGATREVVGGFEGKLTLRYAHKPQAGLASVRNHGTLLAQGELVLFLDDETVASPALLEAHSAVHRRFPEAGHAVLGFTALAPSVAADPLVQFVTEVEGFPVSYRNLRDGDLLDFRSFRAACSSCKRAFLVDQGLFSPALHAGCEDVELALRLSHRGFQLVYCSHAVTIRVDPIDFDAHCRERYGLGESQLDLSLQYPVEAVRQWAAVAAARTLWHKVAPTYEALLRSARELDRAVRLRRQAGLTVDSWDLTLLHRGYWTAFRAARAKGIVDRARELGRPGSVDPAAGKRSSF